MAGQASAAGTGARLAALALAWLAGVALQLQERALSPGPVYAGLALAGAGGAVLAWRWHGQGHGRRAGVAALLAGVVGLGLLAFGVTGAHASLRLSDGLDPALEGQDLQVTGVVASLPQHNASGLRFRFHVEQASWRAQPVHLPPLLALGWYSGFHEDAQPSPAQAGLRAGQRWSFTLRLRRPHGNLNPHGFDLELALFEQGVRATGYVRDAPATRLADAAGYPLERLRQRVRDGIEAHVDDPRAAGVLAALAVGDQAAIEREDWDLFRNTGIAHLMSISGLHVTMFAWLAGLGAAALWRRSPRALLWLPAPQVARWGGVAAALAYALFSGWGVPSQRTVWMLATVALLHSRGARWPWPLVLLSAAVVVTLADPWALLQPGFWLSYAAVGLLMASAPAHGGARPAPPGPGWRQWPARLFAVSHEGLRTQFVATVGLTPLSLVFFQQVSLVGVLANLVAIPLVTLLVTPLALLGVVVAPLWSVGAWVVQQGAVALAWLLSWPAAVWAVAAAPVWAQAAGLLGAALAVLPLPWRLRLLALPLVLPLLVPAVERPAPGSFELVAVDVGQGTSVLVRTHDHLLVYDAGPQYSRDSDAGQRLLLPLLRARGEAHVDRLVLSHRDTDHVGGARSLLGAVALDELSSSLEAAHPLLALAPRQSRCAAGQGWAWDGVRFDVLWPPVSAYDAYDADGGRPARPNAMSCVLRVVAGAGGASALLTGDIEQAQEGALVAALGEALRSDVVVVPHHGSRTSSSLAFLAAVAPHIAVVQSGYRNRFGHPAPDVVQRYREAGVSLRVSPSCGAWTWLSNAASQAGPVVDEATSAGVCQRDAARRYWHLPGAIGLEFATLKSQETSR